MSWLSTSKVSTTLRSPVAPRTPELRRVAAAPTVPKDSYQTRTQAEELSESKQWLPACRAQAQLGLASASGALWFSCLCRVPPRRAQAPPRHPRDAGATSRASQPVPGMGSGTLCLVSRDLVGGEGMLNQSC